MPKYGQMNTSGYSQSPKRSATAMPARAAKTSMMIVQGSSPRPMKVSTSLFTANAKIFTIAAIVTQPMYTDNGSRSNPQRPAPVRTAYILTSEYNNPAMMMNDTNSHCWVKTSIQSPLRRELNTGQNFRRAVTEPSPEKKSLMIHAKRSI